MRGAAIGAVFALASLASATAGADVTLLLCEPYGRLARFSPTGHIAVYLDRVCADTPTVLRRCEPGETGVVISRYKQVAGADWLAVPLIPYLYAVSQAVEVPASADRQQVAALRNAYREAHLRDLVPDGPGGQPPNGNWFQLVGAAYDRRIVAFTVKTTAEQDDDVIRTLNERPNRSRFSTVFRNCADFARDVIDLYYPKALKNNLIADLGLTTPKQVAKSLVQYTNRQPELPLSAFVVPQIPGSRGQSGATRGVLESLVKKAMYLVPLALVQPWIPTACAAGYLVAGRFDPRRHSAGEYSPADLEAWAKGVAAPGE